MSDTLSVVEQEATSKREPLRVVTLTWHEVPPLANELGLLASALAQATLETFPSMYGLRQLDSGISSTADVEAEVQATLRAVPDVDGMACRRILTACHRGEPPTLRLSRAEQVRQYALAIEPRRLLVLIAVVNPPTAREPLISLAHGAEWLANNSQSRVVLVLSSELSGRTELDHVTYDSCVFVDDRCDEMGPGDSIKADHVNGPDPRAHALTKNGPVAGLEPAVSVSPIVGSPAKHSDSEQALYHALTADRALRELFTYNQRVTTRFGTIPTVDLLWEAGKLVIEIDGHDHRRIGKYSSDRRRDYELALSGYMVIRFTDSRVIEDMSSVLQLIRDAVRYQGQGER